MSTIFPQYEQKSANNKRQVFEVKKITSPNCEWYTLHNFELSKIPQMFVPAIFQRKYSTAHVYRIVESIINNTFYDNTIRCVKLPNGKYEVIDGQHRLKALWILHKQYGIQHYSLVMQHFKTSEAREVFRKINSGKKLTTMDYLKTLDDGTYTFFDELRDYATHKVSKIYVSYLNLLNGVNYLRARTPRPLGTHALEDMLSSIDSDEMAHMYRLAKVTCNAHRKLKNDRVFVKSTVLPLFVIGYTNNYSQAQYANHLEKILADAKIAEILKERFSTMHKELFVAIDKFTEKEES